uniref:Uncharacterized protein n=1 Tax=Meleagris gallopavo TaxID=9103 RepID=A0A803Y4K2_MELGA
MLYILEYWSERLWPAKVPPEPCCYSNNILRKQSSENRLHVSCSCQAPPKQKTNLHAFPAGSLRATHGRAVLQVLRHGDVQHWATCGPG